MGLENVFFFEGGRLCGYLEWSTLFATFLICKSAYFSNIVVLSVWTNFLSKLKTQQKEIT